MSFISKQPSGLLGFLGIKNFGRNPQSVGEVLAPTWDLQRLYLENETRAAEVVAAIGTGYNVCLNAQPGEVLFVHDASVAYTTAAGGAASFGLMRSLQNNLITINVTDVTTVGASTGGVKALERSLILAPGENLGVFCTNLVGPQNFYFRARYSVLQM